MTIQAGRLIVFSTGEYSDYGYEGHFVTLAELTQEHFADADEKAMARYRAIDSEQDEWTAESGKEYPMTPNIYSLFIAELIRAGLLLAITVNEIHLGSYRTLSAIVPQGASDD